MSAASTVALALQTESPFLRELLSNPIQFGPVYSKSSFAPTHGVREVPSGPPSPPPKSLPLRSAPSHNAEAGPSTPPRQNGFIGPVVPSHLAHPPPASSLPPSAKTTPVKANGHVPPSTVLAGVGAGPLPSPGKGKARESQLPPLYPPIPISSLGWPEELQGRKTAPAGLHNPSMACYANATLQVLLHTPPLLAIMAAHTDSSKREFCFLCILRDLPHFHAKRYSPKEVHANLGQIKKGFNRNRQEDAHEFFRFVTDALQNTALAGLPKTLPNPLKHTSWVYRLWGGQVRSRVVCSRCLKPSDTFDDFLDLSLDCHVSKRSVGQMLQGYIKEERLEGDNKYHCENCKSKATATKSFRISASPPILTLHLKRFSVNYNAYSGRARADKFTQHIDFPALLDLAPYMIDHSSPIMYRLFGVTCHRGAELRYGHYTSYVRGPTGQWWHCDDDDVSPARLEHIKSERSAYLLSYIRVEGVPGDHATQTPKANGVVTPKPNGTTPREALTANGHAAPSPASAAIGALLPSSPLKRKRDPDEPTAPPNGVRRVRSPPPSSPERPTNLFPNNLDTPNPRTVPSDRFYPSPSKLSHPPSSPANDNRPVQGWQASPNGNRSLNKKQRKRQMQKEKRERHKESHGHGPPMPFAQGRPGGMQGMKNRVGRMQGKK